MAATMGLDTTTAVIGAGTALSAAVNLGVGRIRGIQMPGVWTAAVLTFQVSVDGTNFFELIDDRPSIGYVYTSGYAVTVSQFLCIDPVLFDGVPIIKIRSGTAASAVNQVAAATLTLALRLV
jgi:hypothetical protein